MKRLVKGILGAAVSLLPSNAATFLIRQSARRLRDLGLTKDLFCELEMVLCELGVTELGVRGDLGKIFGSSRDRFVLPMYATARTFESAISKEIQKFFTARDYGTYFDIGANIGLTTIPIAANPSVRCVAFEPVPENFEFLKQNVRQNVVGQNVELHNIAVFDRTTAIQMALSSDNLGDHRIRSSPTKDRVLINVPAQPLDDFFDRVNGPLAIKMDIQGAEPLAIAGGQRVISKADFLALEFCPYLIRQLGCNPKDVLDLVQNFNSAAILRPASSEAPTYVTPKVAHRFLLNHLESAKESDGEYWDVLLRR